MRIGFSLAVSLVLLTGLSGNAVAQESKAAQNTRKLLQQKLSIDLKEFGTKAFIEEANRELEKPVKNIFIDNGSGVSNNSKMTFKAKDITFEKLLNELAEKYDWGWYVESNEANNKVDGRVVIRKSSKGKERGYEAGKEPKK